MYCYITWCTPAPCRSREASLIPNYSILRSTRIKATAECCTSNVGTKGRDARRASPGLGKASLLYRKGYVTTLVRTYEAMSIAHTSSYNVKSCRFRYRQFPPLPLARLVWRLTNQIVSTGTPAMASVFQTNAMPSLPATTTTTTTLADAAGGGESLGASTLTTAAPKGTFQEAWSLSDQ